jgi:hypothetical protein
MGKSLAKYMIPSVFVQLDAIPLTANGKVDKKALPEPVVEAEERDYVAPKTELQKKLCSMFAYALGTDKVSITDNFFEIGGTSLNASKIAMKAMMEKLPIVFKDIFDYPTVQAMEMFINGKMQTTPEAKEETAKPAAAPVPKVNPYLIRVNTEERIMITKQTFKLGKASMGVDYSIAGNGAISRVHAIITGKDGEYFIKDNKSTNHTFVNGKSIEEGESIKLTDNCKIVLGDEEFVFKVQ